MDTLVEPPRQLADGSAPVRAPIIDPRNPAPRTSASIAPGRRHGWRRLAMFAGMLAAPAMAGLAIARATTARRGVVAGGLTAFALGALRVELARWFTPEPSFAVDGTAGELELRRTELRVEASAVVYESGFEAALDRGYGLLACYACGANTTGEILERTTPILTSMRNGRYTVSFVMPPGRTIDDLPRPLHPNVRLREVPAQSIAALRFHGRFSRNNVAKHERKLLQELIDAGLSARGSILFAAFDSPLTLPLLRRNEVWIETV